MLDFGIGWTELLVIGVVALLVVPPKDLPVLLRTLGRYVGQMRRMATDFRSQFDQAMRDAEMSELRDSLKKETDAIKSTVAESERSVQSAMREADKPIQAAGPSSSAIPPQGGAVASASVAAAAAAPAATTEPPTPATEPEPALATADASAPAPARGAIAQRAAEAWKKAAGGDSGA
jgi:sec-independent protein translocase protein TatB